MEDYDKNAWYRFTDQNGNTFTSRGDNGYVWQSMTEGIPISVNDKGEWYTSPYLEVTPNGYVSHIPSWFKDTDEYNQWINTYIPQLEAASPTVDNFNNAQNVLKSLGNQGSLRLSVYNQAEDVGITDPDIKQYVYNQYLSAINEGVNKEGANLVSYTPEWKSDTAGESVADLARYYKSLSKEDLSKKLLQWEYLLKKDNTADTQQEKAIVLATYKILNLVADSPSDFGDGKEFEGLLEASEWQKFQTHANNVIQTISENLPIVTFGARLGAGLGSLAGGKSFAEGWQIEKRRDQQYGYLRSEATGGGLRGTEGSAVSGTWAGAIVSMAGTMVESAAFGTWFNATSIGASIGGVLKGGGTFLGKLGGGMVFDFFFNDIPVDLSLFAADLASTGSAQEAWESQTGQTQPLFGLFGPQVPAGLKYNLIGDAVLDLTLPVVGIANRAMWSKLDTVTGGAVTKIRENVALKNLAVQQKISDLPVIGTGIQKFSNWLFGAENASFIREKRKEAIIKGSMTPYIDAQNLLTLKNHYGAEVVAPMYKHLSDELGVTDQVKYFTKNADQYGGFGETKVEWDEAKGGVKSHKYETVKDDLPRDVKAGLLDYQRLEELKGARTLEGEDLVSNPKRDKEIATLERRIENLPDEIKKFAESFSELNKRVEAMGIDLGLTTKDWIDALLEDPRWKNYMTRQVLVPGGTRNIGSFDPATNKILTGQRTGYYNPDKTLSPLMTLDMKVHAMGNAYAWNERAKALVAAELVQGKITSGGDSIELAKLIQEKRAQIAEVEAVKNQIGFDGIVNGYNERMMNLSSVVNKINEKMNSLEKTTVKSVYTSGGNVEIEAHIADFNAGKITYAEGVREKAGLTVQEGNTVITNTYKLGVDTKGETPKAETPKVETPKPTRVGEPQATFTKEQFKSKYGYDSRATIMLGKINTPEDGITVLKDMTDANNGFISNKDVEKVLNKFPELRKEYDEIVTTLRDDYTRDDVITELYNRRVADVQGTPHRLTVEEADLYFSGKKPGAEPKAETPESTIPLAGKNTGEVHTSVRNLIENVVSEKTRTVPSDANIEIVRAELRRDVSEKALDKLEEYGYLEAKKNGQVTDAEHLENVRKCYWEALNELLTDEEKALIGKVGAEPKVETPKITNPILGQAEPQSFTEKMFHGSGKPASEIYVGAPVPVLGEGKYWAFDEEKAKNFGDNIETETITLERPLIIRSDEDWRELTKQAGWKFPNPLGVKEGEQRANAMSLKRMVTKAGYDGIIVYVGKSQDGLLRDVFSIDQVVSYKPKNDADIISASEVVPKENYYAGVAANGTPYRYTINNGKITSMEKITDSEGLAESLHGINKNFNVSAFTVEKMGEEYAAALNRAAMFFRDNFPNINVGSSFILEMLDDGVWGHVVANPPVHVREDGTISVDFKSVLSTKYYTEGKRDVLRASMERSVKEETRRLPGRQRTITGTWHPKNTVDFSQAPIHEATHTLMLQLTMLEENIKIKQGLVGYTVDTSIFGQAINRDKIYNAKRDTEDRILQAAATRIGRTFGDDLRAEISIYALWPREIAKRNAETITEAMVDYAFNGTNASEFSVAIVQEISERLQRHAMTISPSGTMKENGLNTPKGLLDGENYAFPDNVKTQAQKAEWLNQWRQKNPYLKGELNEETFQKANLWDSYFQKEARSYDPNCKTEAPEALLKKSGDYVEKTQREAAQTIVSEIKRLSGEDFDSDLAMMIIGRNGNDISAAMDNYILRKVEEQAQELAKNMEGGATPENLNIARVTLWSDESIKASTKDMLTALVPDGGDVVSSKVDILFDEQAKGLAAYDKLPVDSKALIEEKKELVEKLHAENKKVLGRGRAMDKNSSFRNGASHVIHYKEGGEDVFVTVDDPVIASILQKPYDYKENGLLSESLESMANFLATTYRLGTTGVNPMALLRNVLRDPIQAMVTAGFNPLNMSLSPEVFYKTLRQYGLDDDTIAEVSQKIRRWAESSTMTEEMRLGPGKNPKTYRNGVEKVNNKLKDVTNGKVIRTLQAPLETWEGFFRNQVGQQSFVKNFQRTGDVNKALSSALFDTSNATTNFSHAIGKWKWATSTVPYLSSAINGTVSFWRLFNIDPLGMTARITAGFMLPVMAITMWNLSSDENRKAYETLPEWFKQGHLVMTDGQGNIIAFPLPEEIQNFAGTARKLIEYTQEVSPYSIATIAAQGAFGFLPFEVDGFWGDDGSLQLKEGAFQMVSGLIPQAATTLYEFIWEHDLFTGEDLSTYNGLNKTVNTLSNIFGTGIKQAINSVGIMFGASEKDIIGKSFQDTIARDLFGMGFDAAKNQFMSIVGSPSKMLEDGSMTKATGLFKENEELKKQIDALSSKIATASDDEKAGLEEQKEKLINDFTTKVANAMDKYQRMFSMTGGLEAWQKNRIVQVLTLGDAWSSGGSDSYQSADASTAYLNERGLAQQRYVEAGLPAGPDLENLVGNNSIELQAALNKFYGVTKQATQDYKNAIEESGIKDIRNEFYNAISKIYDAADEQGKSPDYDLIEKIQARYLQSVDSVLIPIINQYGINILNNNDFIDAVRKQVNGMIPSDDWRQSARNAKKFLSTKDFPTATVDVKKWLKNRYSSGMRDRNIASDQEVTNRIESIKADIDAGRYGSAKGKIEDLKRGVNKANFYISSKDLQTLNELYNMVK